VWKLGLYILVALVSWWYFSAAIFRSMDAEPDETDALAIAALLGLLFAFLWPLSVAIGWMVILGRKRWASKPQG